MLHWSLAIGTMFVAVGCSQSEDLVRSRAVRDNVFARGVKDEAVLAALRATPREPFLGSQDTALAYADGPAPTADGQIVPSTYLVGLVLSLARPQGDHRVLEYGTGTGYQAAVLAKLAAKVHTMDASAASLAAASQRWEMLGITNVDTKAGAPNDGWAAAAPFDLVILWNAPPYIPAMLTNQLQPGGRMVLAHGPLDAVKELRIIEKRRDSSTTERVVVPVAR
jgi:protein-L-isoaspartate(D-aspartate) O-methyltransferase